MRNPGTRICQALQGRGVKVTEPRKKIAEVVASFEGSFAAGDLLAAVARAAPEIGRATVFRTLQLLCDLGLLERLRLANGQDVYVLGHFGGHHHHHLICSSCGDVQEVEECEVGDLARRLASRRGFAARGHTFEIYGFCPQCRRDRA